MLYFNPDILKRILYNGYYIFIFFIRSLKMEVPYSVCHQIVLVALDYLTQYVQYTFDAIYVTLLIES